jgi:hypothetical protein
MRPFAPCFGKLVAGAQVYLFGRGRGDMNRLILSHKRKNLTCDRTETT